MQQLHLSIKKTHLFFQCFPRGFVETTSKLNELIRTIGDSKTVSASQKKLKLKQIKNMLINQPFKQEKNK